jgi:peptidyl-prolyl cis-trans isomerase C
MNLFKLTLSVAMLTLVSSLILLNAPALLAADADTGEAGVTKEINIEDMKFNVMDAEGAAGASTAELLTIAPEEVLATIGALEIKGKDFNAKLDEQIPPYVPRNTIKKADKERFLEQMIDDKMLEMEIADKKFEDNEQFKQVMSEIEKRVVLHFFMTDKIQQQKAEASEAEIKDYYDKNKEAQFKTSELENVKAAIGEELKNQKLESFLTKFWLDMAKDYEVKTNETGLAKIKDIDKLDSAELSLVLYDAKSLKISLADLKKAFDTDKIVSQNKSVHKLDDPQYCSMIADNLLKAHVLSDYANKNGYSADKNEKVKTEIEKIKTMQQKKLFIDAEVFKNITVNPDDIKKHYEDNKAGFRDDQIKASHILVASEDKAKEIEKQLKEGKNFEELAKAESSCPSKEKGGDLGSFGRGMMVKEFETAAFATNKGELSPIVKTQFGYHIIKVTDKTEGKQREFAEESPKIEAMLKRDKQMAARDTFQKYLHDKYKPQLFKDKIR